jgi:hypothetical protein
MSKQLKRDAIKYIRDRAKSAYEKGNSCHICGETENLDFHHYYTLSPLLRAWLLKKKYKEEDVLEYRDEFIAENHAEMYDHTVTLCHTHHLQLHSIYGKDPSLGTAKKQMRWVQIQREKHGLV